jgi:hypothetical protein
MSVTKLLKESDKWLKQAEKTIPIRKAPKQPEAPFREFVERREGEIKARISALEAQRTATVKRYDQAIAEQEEELKRLREEVRVPDRPKPD